MQVPASIAPLYILYIYKYSVHVVLVWNLRRGLASLPHLQAPSHTSLYSCSPVHTPFSTAAHLLHATGSALHLTAAHLLYTHYSTAAHMLHVPHSTAFSYTPSQQLLTYSLLQAQRGSPAWYTSRNSCSYASDTSLHGCSPASYILHNSCSHALCT